jgi:hypothetical protein
MERDLNIAFIGELKERKMRCLSILADNSFEQLSADDCGQFAQEFDSLVGAARVINRPDIEQFARQLTLFAQYLRLQPESEVNRGDYDLLVQAVAHLELLLRELSEQQKRHQIAATLVKAIEVAMQFANENTKENT